MYEIAILSASLLANIFLLTYAALAARKLYIASVNLNAIQEVISRFKEHVEAIHETEMFYGDQTLQAMITHSKEVLDEIDTYEDLLVLAQEEEPEVKEDA